MQNYPFKRAASLVFEISLRDTSNRRMTGLTPTLQIMKDGGAFASAAGTIVETATGSKIYRVTLTTVDMDADRLYVLVTAPLAIDRDFMFFTAKSTWNEVNP